MQAKKTLVLLPHIAELLQDTDNDAASNASAMALCVLSNMLRMLEGAATSLTVLQLAPTLRLLFDNVRLVQSPVPPPWAPPFVPPATALVLFRGMLCPTAPRPHCCLWWLCAASQTTCVDSSQLGLPSVWGQWWQMTAGTLSPADVHPAPAASPSPPRRVSLSSPQPQGTQPTPGRPSAHCSSLPFGAGLPAVVLAMFTSVSAPCSPWAWG